MKTRICLTKNSITAAVGRDTGRGLELRGCYHAPLPYGLLEGNVISGMDELAQHLGEFLNAHKLRRKNLGLVIETEGLSTQTMEVPLLPHRQLMQLIRNEQDAGAGPERLCDYSVITPRTEAGTARLLTVWAERALIERYAELFAKLGVAPESIDITQACANRFVRGITEFRDRTFIFSLLDGRSITSLLCSDNECLLINTATLYEPRGTPGSAVEISRSLSGMMQFNYTRAAQSPLTNIYLCGMIGDEPRFYADMVEALSLPVGPPPPTAQLDCKQRDIEYGSFLFCLGALFD